MRRRIHRRAGGIPDDPEEFKATLGEHLDELRTRIIRVLTVLILAWIGCWFAVQPVIDYLVVYATRSLKGKVNYQIVFHDFTEAFMFMLQMSFSMALVVGIPFAVSQMWGFIKPGLKPTERKVVSSVGPWTILLFLLGVGCCWLIVPNAIAWLTDYVTRFPGATLMQTPAKLVMFVVKFMLAFGLSFQLPIIVYILGRIGILTPDTLMKYWRQATAAIFVIATVITPSNDPGSMLMMAIPLSALFMISVFVVKFIVKPPKDAIAEDASKALDSSND